MSWRIWKKNIDRNNYKKKIINIGVDIEYINKNQNKNRGILILSELLNLIKLKSF